jgi:hypothetical protein
MNLPNGDPYRDPDTRLCQGDILRFVPHLHLRAPFRVIRQQTFAGRGGNQQVCIPCDTEPPQDSAREQGQGAQTLKFDYNRGEEVAAHCRVELALVFSHGCDIDKNVKSRLVVPVYPLTEQQSETSRTAIRAYRRWNAFFLPAHPPHFPDSYADFRRITSIEPSYLKDSNKCTSLNTEWVKAFQLLFFQFISRYEINEQGVLVAVAEPG